MQRTTFYKKINELKPITAVWLLGVVFGNPFYNMVVYLICAGQEWYIETGTNVILVNKPIYVLCLIIIFLIRFSYHRWRIKSSYDMNLWFNLEVFAQRKAYQVIGLLTFLMWTGEVEGNIAGFIYFPTTILLIAVLWIINFRRLRSIPDYITTKY